MQQVYHCPFFVAFDDTSECVVISIRGTFSLEDVIVVMLAEGKRLTANELPVDVRPNEAADFYVHMGILSTARNLRDLILRLRLIEKARAKRPTYPLVVCGHSLGAGVASVLAFLLRKYHPEVKAYAYSPPLGLMRFGLLILYQYTEIILCWRAGCVLLSSTWNLFFALGVESIEKPNQIAGKPIKKG